MANPSENQKPEESDEAAVPEGTSPDNQSADQASPEVDETKQELTPAGEEATPAKDDAEAPVEASAEEPVSSEKEEAAAEETPAEPVAEKAEEPVSEKAEEPVSGEEIPVVEAPVEPEAVLAAKGSAPEKAVPAAAAARRPAQNRGGDRGGDRRNQRGGRRDQRDSGGDSDGPELMEKVVHINRCAKVVKGGRRFSFSALVVAGDQNGQVGYGFGKAKEVAEAIRKASDSAKKSLVRVPINGTTIPHDVFGEFGGGKVLLRPASEGTGIVAGGGVRAVLEVAGVKDILAKSMGSSNHCNVVKSTLHALGQLRMRDEVFKRRGKLKAEKAI